MIGNFDKLHIPRVVTCAVATAIVLGGSSCSILDQESETGPRIGRCFDEPIPVDEGSYRSASEDPVLEYSFESSGSAIKYAEHLKEDPISDKTVRDEAKSGIVRIVTNDSKGTGVMISSDGTDYIATAAHVVYGQSISDLKIVNNEEEDISILSGCLVYEEDGHFYKESEEDERVADIDFAILRVSDSEESFNGLKMAAEEPKRGEWTHFINYQGINEPGYPANYTGVVVADEDNNPNKLEITTGLNRLKMPASVGDFEDNTIQSGASGGPVLNEQGEVVGISVSGLLDGYYETPEELDILYNVNIEGVEDGYNEGLMPVTAGVIPIDLIYFTLNTTGNI